uniref:Uncharacterized protein n=1 Tax=Octopus bimaculoides TaxID=37653 RepID=A0A0L8GP84_OCTBM
MWAIGVMTMGSISMSSWAIGVMTMGSISMSSWAIGVTVIGSISMSSWAIGVTVTRSIGVMIRAFHKRSFTGVACVSSDQLTVLVVVPIIFLTKSRGITNLFEFRLECMEADRQRRQQEYSLEECFHGGNKRCGCDEGRSCSEATKVCCVLD